MLYVLYTKDRQRNFRTSEHIISGAALGSKNPGLVFLVFKITHSRQFGNLPFIGESNLKAGILVK
jgi:hypothetical protein